jgi:DNA-3-methyladenine glycosylase
LSNNDTYKPLPREFYLRNTLTVAEDLLGKVLVLIKGKTRLAGKIVETEAYIGDHDPACHAYQKFTKRSKTLYENGGTVYVYFVYGNYYCFNIVTEKKGFGCAVLVRALEPFEGIKKMTVNRKKAKTIFDLTNGPSKLCMAFGIDLKFNNGDITENNFFVSEPVSNDFFRICKSKRIGLNVGTDFMYRFFIKDNPFVSKHKINKEGILIN